MAIIQSGDSSSSSLLTVDPTSKALRGSKYDNIGGNIGAIGQRAAYCASVTSKTNLSTGGGTFFAIYGSSTRIIRVQRILIFATLATTAAYLEVDIINRFNRDLAFTTVPNLALTQVPTDSNNPPGSACLCAMWGAASAPTVGTGGGTIASKNQFAPVTGTPVRAPAVYDFDWRRQDEAQAPRLHGVTQGLEAAFGAAPATAPSVTCSVWWTEEFDQGD